MSENTYEGIKLAMLMLTLGKPCKERMMNVLVQEQAPSKLRISDFDKEECISTIQLTERFMELQLGDVFKEYIKPLL
ncbi:hypothetical protein AWC38_SpisGene7552 [Stylophora pistillata]|uniref:Uncharacterized protein n=1 Tax=Stylophora pistillata TaxID=50429 RepID=A0A2B4SED4_STYPI|nr:hypothetical protein AWC38_SpisGene7552 [Stylophora pistillata]